MKDESVTVRLAEISDYSVCIPFFKLLYHGDIGPDFKNVFQDYIKEGAILLARTSGKLLGILVGSYNWTLIGKGESQELMR